MLQLKRSAIQAAKRANFDIICMVSDCEKSQVKSLRNFEERLLFDFYHMAKSLLYGLTRNSKLISVGVNSVPLSIIHGRSAISLSRIDKNLFEKSKKI